MQENKIKQGLRQRLKNNNNLRKDNTKVKAKDERQRLEIEIYV